jgi:hypothetical protein
MRINTTAPPPMYIVGTPFQNKMLLSAGSSAAQVSRDRTIWTRRVGTQTWIHVERCYLESSWTELVFPEESVTWRFISCRPPPT